MADLKQRLAPLEGIDMPERWSEIRQRAPRAGFDPEPPRRQPLAVIALAGVLSVVTLGWLATAFGDADDDRVADEPAWVTTAVPELGLRIEHPSGWDVRLLDEPTERAPAIGVLLSKGSIDALPVQVDDDGPFTWDPHAIDAGVVVVSVVTPPPSGATLPSGPIPELVPPLSLDGDDTLRVAGVDADGRGTTFVVGMRPMWLENWTGSAATAQDRAVVDRIVASIEPTTPQASPSQVEPEPTLDPRAVDLGLDFGICDAESLTGAFGTGESTRVWFGTRTNEESLRCVASSRRFALAIDVGGDRTAEAWIDPIGPQLCFNDCGLTGVVDLDGDGTDELVLLLEGGVTPTFGVVDVRANGEAALMGYVDGDAPQGLPGDGPAKLTIGGDEAYSYAVSCTVDAGGPLITQQAVAGVVDAPEQGARVATYSLRLTPEGFLVVSDDVQEGVDPPPDLSLRGSLCGLELPSPFGP